MNRKHTAALYRRLVERLRRTRPDLALSTDFIVGFPGEDEGDFEATLKLAEDVGFAQAYAFKYSPRPGTPAAAESDQVPEPVKGERLARLQSVIQDSALRFNRASLGRTVPVLLDRPGTRAGQLHGRTPHMQAVHVTAPPTLLGTLAPVLIETAQTVSLGGRLAEPEMAREVV